MEAPKKFFQILSAILQFLLAGLSFWFASIVIQDSLAFGIFFYVWAMVLILFGIYYLMVPITKTGEK